MLLSLGLKCLLVLLGMSVSISLDGSSVTTQYPRFIAFCLIVGASALSALVGIFIFNIKVSEKYNLTKKIWWFQMIASFVISIPMIKLWEMLFDYLQKLL